MFDVYGTNWLGVVDIKNLYLFLKYSKKRLDFFLKYMQVTEMDYFILFVCVILGTSSSIISRIIKKGTNKLHVASATNTASFLIALLTIFIIGVLSSNNHLLINIKNIPISLAMVYGLCVMLAQFSFLLAVGRGPVSISTLFYSCGFIIPTFYGIIRFQEQVRILQIIGVMFIVCSLFLSTKMQKGKKKIDVLWLMFALGGMFFSGGIGIVQKEFGLIKTCSVDTFIFYSLAFAFILNLILTLVLFLLEKDKKNETQINAFFLIFLNSLILGAIMGLANKLNTYITGIFDSVKTFPVINGGRIILTTIMSAIIFKEKTDLKQKLGIIIGFIAIVLIAIK